MSTKKVSVIVKNSDINKALKILKNKTFDSGHLVELRERQTYTKPKTKRRLIKLNAIRNNKRFLSLNQD
jgi:ribosomal protein S21